ncbi:tRNA-specific adenosine deaminase [Corynebacterium glaucum]|nr:tRNA-specific adenosine deaminase [Corynebacterium glaucum]
MHSRTPSSSAALPDAALPDAGRRAAETRMHDAIELARGTPAEDVPVGAIVFAPGGEVVGRGVNRREANCDPTAHAEVEAIRQAAATLGSWRLDGCELVVTLEPCTMCAGAILGARVRSLVFGAYEPKTGAVGSVLDALRDPHHLHQVEVRGGVLEAETAALMSEFFGRLRP